MKTAIIMQIRAFHGYVYETVGVVTAFFSGPEQAKACAEELKTRWGTHVTLCGCQLTVGNS